MRRRDGDRRGERGPSELMGKAARQQRKRGEGSSKKNANASFAPCRLQEEPFLAHSTHEEHERKANARSGECLKKDKHYGAPFFASNSPIFSAVLPVSGTTKPPRAPQLIVLR